MNLKQAKRLRRLTNGFLRQVTGIELASVRDVAYDDNLVPSRRKHYSVRVPKVGKDGLTTLVEQKDTAIQIRLKRGIGRSIYKRVKRRVQTTRRAKQSGILSGIRDDFQRAVQAAAARSMEHSGAEGIQREHSNLPVM